MALRFLEGFEEYTTTVGTALINEMIAMRSNSGYRWQYGYYTGYNLELNSTVRVSQGTTPRSLFLTRTHMDLLMPTVTEIIVGFAVYFSNNESTSFFSLSNSNSTSSVLPTTGISLRRSVIGFLEVVNNNSSAVIATSTNPCLPMACWHYLEIRYKYGATGDIQVRVENVDVINLSGIDTRGTATGIQNLALFSSVTSTSTYFDDLYICDSTGTTNNTFLGPVVVHTLTPSLDAQADFTRNTGTNNYSCVNEIPHDSATSYVSSNIAGKRDLYEMSDISGSTNIGPIVGVQSNARGQALGTPASFALTVESAGGTQVGLSKTQTTGAWMTDFEIFEKQADGSAWTLTTVNNAKAGFDIV